MDNAQGMQRTNHCVSCGEIDPLQGRPRQIMGQHPVPKFSLRLGDDIVGFGQLLDVVCAAYQRVVVILLVPDLHHVQDLLRVLWVILIPAVVKGLAMAPDR